LASGISAETKWADLSKKHLIDLSNQLTNAQFQVNGKSTFKEEFVTAGGIDLREIDFKTMQSKILPNLYFAGEIVNIDAITGGFNFQNAWTKRLYFSQGYPRLSHQMLALSMAAKPPRQDKAPTNDLLFYRLS
jgi:predicted flavoprotein YhiN